MSCTSHAIIDADEQLHAVHNCTVLYRAPAAAARISSSTMSTASSPMASLARAAASSEAARCDWPRSCGGRGGACVRVKASTKTCDTLYEGQVLYLCALKGRCYIPVCLDTTRAALHIDAKMLGSTSIQRLHTFTLLSLPRCSEQIQGVLCMQAAEHPSVNKHASCNQKHCTICLTSSSLASALRAAPGLPAKPRSTYIVGRWM